MKLLEEIWKARGFTGCVATTYNINLPWVERLLVRQLRLRGVRHVLILADRSRLSEALESDGGLLRSAGSDYSLLGIDAPVSFHPKLLLLTGPSAARLYIGSGNLTSAGYGRNREVFARFDASADDAHLPGAFATAERFICEICASSLQTLPRFVAEALRGTFGAPVLARPSRDGDGEEVLVSPGAFFDQLDIPPTPATTLKMLAPSFDAEARMAIELAHHFGAETFDVVTDLKTTNLTRRGARAIQEAGGRIHVTANDRPLHAKVLFAGGTHWALSVMGSANLSHAAWRGRNVEAIVMHRGESARRVGAMLDDLPIRDFAAEDHRALAEEQTPKRRPTGPAIASARWDGSEIVLRAASDVEATAVEVSIGGTLMHLPPIVDPKDPAVLRARPANLTDRAQPTLVRLVGLAPGPWALVHDEDALAERARPETRVETDLRGLLGDENFDADGASQLFQLMAKMWRGRLEQRRRSAGEDGESTAAPDGAAPERPVDVLIGEDDFRSSRAVTRDPTHTILRDVPMPANLLHRLLFGRDALECEEDLSEGESDAATEGEGAETNTEPLRERTFAARDALAPTVKAPSFSDAAKRAFSEYVEDLRFAEESRSAGRLIEDMQLLAASLHYVFRAGGLHALELRQYLVHLLAELIGLGTKPLAFALRVFQGQATPEAWKRLPLVQFVGLLAYNVSLLAIDLDSDEAALDQVLRDGPVFWMRNLIRDVPNEVVSDVLARVDRDGIEVRHGAFWLGEGWLTASARLSFRTFLSRLVTDARALLSADRALVDRISAARGRFEEGAPVVGLGRDHALAVGWAEEDNRHKMMAWLHDGAFLEPGPTERAREHQGHAVPPDDLRGGMHCVPAAAKGLIGLDVAREWALEVSENAARGIDVLASIR